MVFLSETAKKFIKSAKFPLGRFYIVHGIKKDGRSTHCYCENPCALGFEIIIIEIQWDLRPVIWEFLLMTYSAINVLLVYSNTTLFFRMMIKKARQILPSYGKNDDKINKLYP